MAKNVLELNGKRYDAITGAYLGVSSSTSAHVPVATNKTAKPVAVSKSSGSSKAAGSSHGKAIDGFIRPTTNNAHVVKATKPKPAVSSDIMPPALKKARVAAPSATAKHAMPKVMAKPVVAKPAKPAAVKAAALAVTAASTVKAATITESTATAITVHTSAAHAKAHKPEKSKTLMRRAVHKPVVAMKPAIKPQAPAEIAAKPLSAIAAKPSVLQVDEERLARAKDVHMSKGIKHFQPVRPDYSPAAIENMPHTTPHSVPVIAVTQAPPMVKAHPREDTDIFEAALARAESHKQPAHRAPKRHVAHRKLINTMAGIAALLVIGGFVAYLNMPNIQLHVASVQAGFTADMPGYKPEGYALKGGVQRIGNTVSMRFTQGENNYTVTQQPSDWNSQTLVDNTVALSNGTYKTVQAGGRNIYVYGKSNAVWVDRGVRYDLTTNTPLSTQDITQLAASL